MNVRILGVISFIFIALVSFGCSGGSSSDSGPIAPTLQGNQTAGALSTTQTHLWGYYDVTIDPVNQSVFYEVNRNVMFSANVVTFLNGNPANIGFTINNTPIFADTIDVDVDISITHPFDNLPQYNGYDVRGVFIGEGSGTFNYGSSIDFPRNPHDQMMLDDPYPDDYDGDVAGGGPDGYTRWFNPSEFYEPGLFGYMPGVVATPGYNAGADINACKYFADGLDTNDSVWEFLTESGGSGVFSSGTTNTRNYYLSFPKTMPIQFNYAVVANWEGSSEEFHPSHAIEPLAASVTITDNVYYTNSTLNGGHIILDISLFGWDANVNSASVMEDYKLYIESSVLYDAYELTEAEMTPVDGTDSYSTFHVDILSDSVTDNDNHDVWVIAEVPGCNYSNPAGSSNDASEDTLAAFFRYDLPVAQEPPNYPPYITGFEDDIAGSGSYQFHVDYYDDNVTYTVLFEDYDVDDTHTITFYITPADQAPDPAYEVTMPVDWSTYESGYYDIHVYVSDGTVQVHGGPWPILMNTVPEITSGIDGEDTPLILNTETYSVTAADPDNGQSLTYSWSLIDNETSMKVSGYDGVSGDGAGNLDIDWQAISAVHDHEYRLECSVSDGMAGIPAANLDITSTLNLYHAVYDDGDGDMFVQYAYYNVDGRRWQYNSAEGLWVESGGIADYFNRYARTRLSTPSLNIPAGISGVKMDVRQWGGTIEGGDRCYIQYATTGTNFANLSGGWWSTEIHGSSTYDITETFNIPTTMINRPNGRIGFYFYSNFNTVYQGVGWKLKEVRIYIVP